MKGLLARSRSRGGANNLQSIDAGSSPAENAMNRSRGKSGSSSANGQQTKRPRVVARLGRESRHAHDNRLAIGNHKSKRKGVLASGFVLTVLGFVIYAAIVSSAKRRVGTTELKGGDLPIDAGLLEKNNRRAEEQREAVKDIPCVESQKKTSAQLNDSLSDVNTIVPATDASNTTQESTQNILSDQHRQGDQSQTVPTLVSDSSKVSDAERIVNDAQKVVLPLQPPQAPPPPPPPATAQVVRETIVDTPPTANVTGTAQKDSLYNSSLVCYVSPRFERVCVFGPLCIDNGELVYLESELSCQRFRVKGEITAVLGDECVKFEKSNMREADLKRDPTPRDHAWLKEKENKGEVNWVEGTSALFSLGGSAANIAHYAGRVLFLTHLRRHAEIFGMQDLDHVLLLASEPVSSRLLSSLSWHGGVLRAATHPMEMASTTHTSFDSYTGSATAGVQVMHAKAGSLPSGRTTCFRLAAIPAFLKGRYFIPNYETPGQKSYPLMPDPNAVPGDAVVLRRNVFAYMQSADADKQGLRPLKRLVYLKRLRRRAFDSSTEAAFEAALKQTSSQLGFEMKTVVFDDLTFPQQVEAVQGAAIAIGLHGANLVNTIFMPPSSYLIEIFPYGFDHDMYRGGCGSGLQYIRFEITIGEEYEHLTKYSDRRECMNKENACKVHYRSDYREVRMQNSDIGALSNLIVEAKKAVEPYMSS